MATTPKRLVEGTVLTASIVTQYTAPGLTNTIIKKVTVANTTGTAQTFTLYLVPSAGTAGVGNMNTPPTTVGANSAVEAYLCENHVLATGDFLAAVASAASALTLEVSGVEVT